jgi:SAM-dependent methyltransferase
MRLRRLVGTNAAHANTRPTKVVDPRDDRKAVLHVGCGPPNPENLHPRFRGSEWREVRLDIDPGVRPDIVDSIVSMARVESDVYDAVWSSHNLEHIYAHEVPRALSQFLRVLRPGGSVLIAVPDVQQVAKAIAKIGLEETLYVSPAGPIAPLDMLYGYRRAIELGDEFMAHRTGFTARTLTRKLAEAGFVSVDVQPRSDKAIWAAARKAG